ncbi:YjbH domain-containing protein [Mangrovibacterium diazotrophicum]|uniref:Exopolysaccharide biosynthesis protein YbjH n=1 Tax=Mangrovibacterium diazotrophicum TaxID=1261403 RepID=A0A419W948_9BACT|nr:YjbH domain-containing protein [Mangrovibacterium diazotrophicum]RKD91991.1 exopolysaccharide biosynthesis protein YbjH [Mangrovibacterium diazotrophicum]
MIGLTILAFSSQLSAQQYIGGSGLLKIPGGELRPDKTVIIGSNYLPEGIETARIHYNTANYFFSISFLPFLEANYYLTFLKDNAGVFNQQDRSFGLKLRAWKEKAARPSLLLGMNDFYTHTAEENNQTFASIYLVSDKTLPIQDHRLKLTLGYGFRFKGKSNLNGLFGGLRFYPAKLNWLELLAEYDSKHLNCAVSVLLWKHLSLYGGWYGIGEPAAGLAYRFQLP